MSEQALIPQIPPIKRPLPETVAPEVPEVVEPFVSESVESPVPESVESTISETVESIVPEAVKPDVAEVSEAVETTIPSEGTIQVVEPDPSTTVFQLVTYASFVLTFCLAGIAAVAVFRKAAKATVKRFSIAAKVLSLSYLVIVFNSIFGTYLYSMFLNRGNTSYPLIVPILSWVFVGPAVSVVLNSLLTREDVPGIKKIIFDAFVYFVIFGFVAASQIPFFGSSEPLIFSFLGGFFLIFPIIRFFTPLKILKEYHPELQEIFVQILIRSLLLLPLLLPVLAFTNLSTLMSDDLALLLFNLVTLVFVLTTGLLMIISIDFITQGINANQLVSKKVDPPIAPSSSPSNTPAAPSDAPRSPAPISLKRASAQTSQKTPEPVSKEQPAKSTTPVVPAVAEKFSPPTSAEEPPEKASPPPLKESSETLKFDMEKLDSTVIDFDSTRSSIDEPKSSNPKSSKSAKDKKPSQTPKAPKLPRTSKSTDSRPRIKPPEKPKKRF